MAAPAAGWISWAIGESSVKLLPVSVIEEREPARIEAVVVPVPVGKIYIELPGCVSIRLEGSVDAATLRLHPEESAFVIGLPAGTRIWIAAGVTDMRRGFHGLSAQVQTALEQQPLSGHVFVFRGRRGDIVKVLWFDGDGLCLLAKRLE